MMSKKYDGIRHDLDTKMIRASTLTNEVERRGFVNQAFTNIHKAYQQKQISKEEYVRLINRLAAYRQGEFNDYMDMLTGAATLGLLDVVIQGELSELSPEQARSRSQHVSDLTGISPIQPEKS